MTFTPDELRRLALADSLTTGTPGRDKGGRPRLVCPNESIARRRASWRRYEDKKHDRLNAFGLPRRRGGRPRTKPNTPKQERRRQAALASYYRRKLNRAVSP